MRVILSPSTFRSHPNFDQGKLSLTAQQTATPLQWRKSLLKVEERAQTFETSQADTLFYALEKGINPLSTNQKESVDRNHDLLSSLAGQLAF